MAIPNIVTGADPIIPGTSSSGNYPSDTGFDYRGGKTTFGFYGSFVGGTSNNTIKIQAAFDDGATNANWIDLTDAQGNAVLIKENDIVSVDIGKCKLRFNLVVGSGTTGPINISAS